MHFCMFPFFRNQIFGIYLENSYTEIPFCKTKSLVVN